MSLPHVLAPLRLPPFAEILARLEVLEGAIRPGLRSAYAKLKYADYLEWRLRRIVAKTERDVNAQCPACGHRDGRDTLGECFQAARWQSGSPGPSVQNL